MNNERTSLFLMANLGSEVSKIFSAKKENDLEMLGMAMTKAKKILSELKNLPDTKDNKEIDIFNDVIDDLGEMQQKYQISPENLISYFTPFAIRIMQV